MGPDRKHVVTARPLTGLKPKIVRNCCRALALAPLGNWLRNRRRDHVQGDPPPRPPALLPPSNLPRVARPPPPTRLPPTPPPGFLATRLTTITTLRMSRPIPPLAPTK